MCRFASKRRNYVVLVAHTNHALCEAVFAVTILRSKSSLSEFTTRSFNILCVPCPRIAEKKNELCVPDFDCVHPSARLTT